MTTTRPVIARYYQARFYFRLPSERFAPSFADSDQVKGQFVMSNAVPTGPQLDAALKCLRDLGWTCGWMEYTYEAPTADQLLADFDEFVEAYQ